MAIPSTQEVTEMLLAWNRGEAGALEQLTPLVYAELRRIAHGHMAGQHPGHTLQTTALVHEAYLRLIDCQQVGWQDRNHFFSLSSRLMRRILVEFARSRQRLKRGGQAVKVSLNDGIISTDQGVDLVALDDALKNLAAMDPRKCQVVELRFFGGLSVQETAEGLQVSPETIHRDWKMAKMWLLRELAGDRLTGDNDNEA